MGRLKRNNVIIGGLLSVILLLGVAYAAFSSSLSITGTGATTNNWDIKITNIESKDIEGDAVDASKSYTDLTANFNAEFTQPGDSITYDITVTNNGSLDAELSDIKKTLPNSEYIDVEFSGFTKGQVLYQNTSEVITVKVSFKDVEIESLTEEVTADISLDLTFTQQGNSTIDNPITKYKVTYDCTTNGGNKCDDYNEYLEQDSNVLLTYTAEKENYDFVGWNTNKDATEALTTKDLSKIDEEDITLYAIYKKDISINYTKSNNVTSISKETDTCTMYNNAENCSVTLPSITISEDTSEYDANWYLENTKVGAPSTTYEVNTNQTLNARQRLTPLVRNSIITDTDADKLLERTNRTIYIETISFVDNKNIPEDAIYSWDVSKKQNGSVTAWLTEHNSDYNLYIGGEDGVIAPENSSKLLHAESMNKVLLTYLYEINVNYLDTSNVTNMAGMFSFHATSPRISGLTNFDTSNVTNMGSMFQECSNLTSLDISNFDTSKVENMSYMFESTRGTLDISNFNTSKVENMRSMFQNSSAEIIFPKKFGSVATNMTMMFCNYQGNELDLSSFNTSNVTNMSDMFYLSSKLTTLDLSSFNTSNVTSMNNMFKGCTGLTTLDLSSFDTSNVTSMDNMFKGCTGLTTLDLSSFDTSNVTSMESMFNDCTNLKTIYASDSFVTTNVPAYMMFDGCTSLVGGIGTVYNTSYRDKTYAKIDTIDDQGYFTDKTKPKLDSLTLSASSPSIINAIAIVSEKSVEATKYEFSLDRKKWIESQNNTYQFIDLEQGNKYTVYARITGKSGNYNEYKNSIEMPSIVVPAFTETNNNPGKTITITYPSVCTDGTYTCKYSKNSSEDVIVSTSTEGATVDENNNLLVPVSFTEAGTLVAKIPYATSQTISSSYTVTMNSLLRAGSTAIFNTSDTINSDITKAKITTIEIKDNLNDLANIEEGYKWDVSAEGNGTVMAWVTKDEENSTDSANKYHLYIGSNGNVVANPDSSSLFASFTALKSANLSKLDTSDVINMASMFSGCTVLKALDVSGFNTANVTDMNRMFYNCKVLTLLDLSSFDTAKVTNMSYMFQSCVKLTTLDISSFNTSKVTKMSYMFGKAFTTHIIETIYASDAFVTDKVSTSSNMFTYCSKLVGGVGTKYKASNVSAKYARIDTIDNPGYFTDKTKPKISAITATPSTNSISVETIASDEFANITKYEYSIDGTNYTESTNAYTFNNLTENTEYDIYVRVTNSNGGVNVAKKTVTTTSSE